MELLYEGRKWYDKQIFIHLTCWAILIFLEVVVAGAINQRFSDPVYYVFFYGLNACLFYFHSGVVMNYSVRGSKTRVWFIPVFLVQLLAYSLLSVILSLFMERVLNLFPNHQTTFNFRYFAVVFYRAAYFLAYSTGYFYLMHYLRRKRIEMQQAVENEQLRSQLFLMQKDYLKAQINPHFLFNTLNFIKIAAKLNPERSEEAIEHLSEIMDYALEDTKAEFIAIDRELEQISHIIQLNQLRYHQKLNIILNKNIVNGGQNIIPLVLLTLVENIFKHGNSLSVCRPTKIEVQCNEHSLYFHSENLIADNPKQKNIPSGLLNVQARLEKSYPNRFYFRYGEEGNIFRTELRIYFNK